MDREGLQPLRIGAVTIDFAGERLVDAAGRPIALRPRSFAVLRRLAAAPGQVVSKAALMDEVWPNLAVTDDSLVQCIHEIRRALGPDGARALRTVLRRGYVLHPPDPLPAADASPAPRRRPRYGALALILLAAAAGLALGAGSGRRPPERR